MTTTYVAGLIVSAVLVVSPVSASAPIAAPKGAAAGKATTTAEDASGKADAIQEKKICKQLRSSGSRLPNRVCLTQKQWKQVEQEAQ
jgi:hypothetical protein